MSHPFQILGLATLFSCGFAAGALAAEAPTALGNVASAAPQFRMPTGEPQKLLPPKPAPQPPAKPAGESGEKKEAGGATAPGGAPGASPSAGKSAPSAAGEASGPAPARGEGKVSAVHPVAFVFLPEKPGLYSISVSSPDNAARIAIFFGDSTIPEAGTSPADGAIRWSSELVAGVAVKIVVLTAGPEIPFRLEASGGASGM